MIEIDRELCFDDGTIGGGKDRKIVKNDHFLIVTPS